MSVVITIQNPGQLIDAAAYGLPVGELIDYAGLTPELQQIIDENAADNIRQALIENGVTANVYVSSDYQTPNTQNPWIRIGIVVAIIAGVVYLVVR